MVRATLHQPNNAGIGPHEQENSMIPGRCLVAILTLALVSTTAALGRSVVPAVSKATPVAGQKTSPAPAARTTPATGKGSVAPGAARTGSPTAAPVATTRGASINGTGLVRPGASTVAIGGAAKTPAGINGNSVQVKHP